MNPNHVSLFSRKLGLVKAGALSNASINQAKIYLALMYWCEGTKTADNMLKFANSDPALIKFFMDMLKKGFKIDLQKTKALIHLHDYHNESRQISFWAKIIGIPKSQFHKSYIKPHTGNILSLFFQP